MPVYLLRIPAISQLWRRVKAKTEEEAFDLVVSKLERDAPNIRWRDRSVWEIKIALDAYGREEKE